MNPFKQLLSQTATYGLSSIVGRLLNYLLVPLYTRYFTTFEYGDVTLLYAYAALLLVALTYGMETAFFRFNNKSSTTTYSTALISLLLSSSLFVAFVFAYSQPIAQSLSFSNNPEYIRYFALIIGLDVLASISFAKLREQQKAVRFATIRLIGIFINIGLNLFFIVYCPLALEKAHITADFINIIYSENIGIGYIFIANLIASSITILLLIPQMIEEAWRFDTRLWKKMMTYALPLMVAGMAGITNETIDRVLLKYLLPADISASEIGLYSAFYKLSILMTLFIQTFRFAAEPFFFAQKKKENAPLIYAQVMKYFSIVTAFIFLVVTIYYDLVIQFIGKSFHDDRGKIIVPILLLANLLLGLYYNLSVWYKLTDNTRYGAVIALLGAVVTLVLNTLWIPTMGFVGSAWATLCCYLVMVLVSYFFSRKYYPIPYPLRRIGLYFSLMLVFYFLSLQWTSNMLINSLYIIAFIIIVVVLEQPKKSVNSSLKEV
ncbi:MAG: lipopolysaccharide biosynthesis protein [Flavobacteriales bacterium]